MKLFLSLGLCFLLAACKQGQPVYQPQKETSKTQPTASLPVFIDTLSKLDPATPNAIDSALHLYSMLVPDDSTKADSAASALMASIEKVVEKENKRLANDSIDLALINSPDSLSEKLKEVATSLHEKHLKPVSNGEGGVYLVPAYETILATVKEKTSTPVDQFLDLTAKEDTSSTFKDAGLAIEMTELVDRLVASENLLSQKLPRRFADDAKNLNQFYSHALIQGADNSPAINTGNMLTDEYQKGYDYLLAKYPASKAAAKINVWMAVVKSGDKRKINDYLKLLP